MIKNYLVHLVNSKEWYDRIVATVIGILFWVLIALSLVFVVGLFVIYPITLAIFLFAGIIFSLYKSVKNFRNMK